MGEGRTRIQLLTRHILYYVYKWWYEDLAIGCGSLGPEEGGFPLDITDAFNHVCLVLVHETSSLLYQRIHVWQLLLD